MPVESNKSIDGLNIRRHRTRQRRALSPSRQIPVKKNARRKATRRRVFGGFKNNKQQIFVIVSTLLIVTCGVGLFIFQKKGQVLGVEEVVRIQVPERYTLPITFSRGKNTLSVAPLSGEAVTVERQNNQYIYRSAYPYTNVIHTDYQYKIKEEMFFSRPGHPTEFRYRLGNIDAYVVEEDDEGNIVFYDREIVAQNGEPNNLSRVFTIFTPFIQDQKHRSFEAVQAEIVGDELHVTLDKNWLTQAEYPLVLDPTVEINVLNLYSHPQQGDDWIVDFTTQGTEDLYIIPDDQATIDDDEFVSLQCGSLYRQPQILENDVIYYPDWYCEETGRIVHYTATAGKHTLRFEFGDQVAYAYNDAGDSWWDTDWSYRMEVNVDNTSNSDTLTDFQFYVNVTSTMTDFWTNTSDSGDDIRFTNQDGSLELPYYQLYYNTSTDEAIYYVKADSIAANSIERFYLYYGNSGATATSSAEDTFSYSTRERRYALMGDYNASGSYVIPFFNNTSYSVGVSTIAQESSDIDTAARVTLASGVLTETGTVISSTKPLAISGTSASADMWSPFSWMSGDMFGFSYQSNPEIEFYNPNTESVLIDVYENNSLDTSGITIAAGAIDDRAYVGSGTNYRASSTLPVMMYIEGGANRVMPIPPSATEWYGHARNMRIAAGAAGASYDVYCSNGSTGSGSVGAYSVSSNTTCNATYGTVSAYIVANNPIEVSAHADGNGSDSQVWMSKKDLDLVHISADNYEYLACTTPYADTDFGVYTISAGSWTQQGSTTTATRTGSDPNPYWFKDSTTRSGGVKILSTNPSYCYIDRDVTSDEANISNIVINRQGTWPEPEVISFGAEESAPTSDSNTTIQSQSASGTIEPVAGGQDLFWSVGWSDPDEGEMIKVIVCKTDSISGGACTGDTWCESPVFTNRNPEGLCKYSSSIADASETPYDYYLFVCDDEGNCTNSTSSTFTITDSAPNAPADLLTDNMPNPVNIATTTPLFSSIYDDNNTDDTATKYCIEVDTQPDFTGTQLWASDSSDCSTGSSLTSSCVQNNRCEDITYSGTDLTLNNTTYYWRMWYWDQGGNKSATSTTASFTTANGEGAATRGVRLKGYPLKGGVRLK